MTGRAESGRWWRWPLLVVICLALLAGGFWAGLVATQPAPVPTDLAASEVVVEVTEQTVGRALNLGVTVEQPKRALAVNALAGVVTSVRKSGTAKVGAVLYSVGRTPVRAVAGDLPFYRELSAPATGQDVTQLRDALVSLGYLRTKGSTFDAATRAAVKAWQKDLGIAQTGTVALGELVAVPTLPVALLIDDTVITVGGVLAGGEKIVYGSTGEPVFSLVLAEQQARLVPGSATVAIDHKGKHWTAVITDTRTDESGTVTMTLNAPDGGPVCGTDCSLVATGSTLNILAKVAVVPPATGPAVPVAAITTAPDGTTSVLVVDAAGSRSPRTVKVIGSQGGIAVVDGVKPGEQVQVFASDGGKPAGTAPDESTPSPSASK